MASIEKRNTKKGVAYRIAYAIDGKRLHYSFPIGTPYTAIKAKLLDIEAQVYKHKAQIKQLDLPAQVRIRLKLSEFQGWYEEQRRYDVAATTLNRYLIALRVFERAVGDRYVAEITSEHIEQFKRHQLKAGKTRQGINKDIHHLKHPFRLAKKKGLTLNEIEFGKFGNVLDREPDYLTPSELERLIDALPAGEVRLAAIILMWTGVRRSELVERVRKSDFNFETMTLRIEGKNRSERKAPIHPRLVAELKENPIFQLRGSDEKLFTISPHSVSDGIRVAKIRAGLDHKRGRTHLLRHSLGMYLINNGFDITEVRDILGHKTLWMTTRYARILKENLTLKFSKIDYK